MTTSGFFSVGSLSGTWVLLVSDDAHGRVLYREILEHCGALVTAVSSADAALEVMRQAKPDVIVTSLRHSAKDDLSLLRRVRALKPDEGGVVPAIVLTPAADREEATEQGFEGRLAIPFDSWALCQMISNVVTI